MSKRVRRWTVVLLLSVLLSGCGMRFVYNNLDWLAYWLIDDYVELTEQQQQQFEPMLLDWLAWHRSSQLPIYLAQLQLLRAQIVAGISPQQLKEQVAAWRENLRVVANYVYRDLAELAQSATPQQVNQFISQLAQQQPTEHRQQSHLEYRQVHLSESVERWLGSVNAQQQVLIERMAEQLVDTRPDWSAVQSKWQQYLAFSMSQPRQQAYLEQRFYVLLVESEQLWPQPLAARFTANHQIWAQGMSEILALANAKQKRHLLAKLDAYIEDLQLLIGDDSLTKPAVLAGLAN
ncbi:DUF6279 family lipoprotein [Agarivorans sp.]|uniref:DUF6279 family lipoprotein n=1 Tax=Agarivorans sp. TaxID=1872412 RepID=UPI003D0257E7